MDFNWSNVINHFSATRYDTFVNSVSKYLYVYMYMYNKYIPCMMYNKYIPCMMCTRAARCVMLRNLEDALRCTAIVMAEKLLVTS